MPRRIFDVFISCLVLMLIIGAIYLYLTEKTPNPAANAVAKLPVIDFAAVRQIIRATPRGEILAAAWTPEKLSPRWQSIIIHHSGATNGNARIFDEYHQKNRGMENGMAYHFVICNGFGGEDGAVEIGKRWREQLDGGHVRGDTLNHTAIGICLVGDFTQFMPTTKQIAALKALLKHLQDLTQVQILHGHRDAPNQKTTCPGYLPIAELATP